MLENKILIALLASLSFVGVFFILKSFVEVFTKENKKMTYLVMIILVVLGLSIWYVVENNKKVVYMKEDVLYITPKKK